MDYSNYCQYAYKTLLLEQPQIHTDGLWGHNGIFYIWCPDITEITCTADGKPLKAWFKNHKPIGAPVSLVNKLPPQATRVPPLTLQEHAQLHDEPKTIGDVENDLFLWLPNEFPEFRVESDAINCLIYTSQELSNEHKSSVQTVIDDLAIILPPKFVVDKQKTKSPSPVGSDIGKQINLDIIPCRLLPDKIPINIREEYEKDQEFWVDNRIPILTGESKSISHILPTSFSGEKSRCLLNASFFPPNNIRIYLTLYEQIILVMPLRECIDAALSSMKLSKSDLIYLASIGRVAFLLPQPIKRYDVSFVSEILIAAPDSMLFSRRLSSSTIINTRKQIPFLYPSISIKEKSKLLSKMYQLSNELGDDGIFIRNLQQEFCRLWKNYEYALHKRGAMSLGGMGVAALSSAILNSAKKRNDSLVDVMTSGPPVEWGALFGATVIPSHSQSQQAYELCASIFSGIELKNTSIQPCKMEPLLIKLLAVNNDVPIKDFVSVFKPSDQSQLNELLSTISNQSVDNGKALSAIEDINKKIIQYEGNQKRLKRFDIVGKAIAATDYLASGSPITIPIYWLLEYILISADTKKDFGGNVIEWIRAKNNFYSKNIVVVSRLQNSLQELNS